MINNCYLREKSQAFPALHAPCHIGIGRRHGGTVDGLAGRDGSGSETPYLNLISGVMMAKGVMMRLLVIMWIR